MKVNSIFLVVLMIATSLVSCSDCIDADSTVVNADETEGVTGSIPEIKIFDDDPTSRSTFTISNGEINFAWEDDEVITVYGDAGNKGDFTLTGVNSTKDQATFDGGGFSLTEGKEYYSLNKSKTGYGDNKHNIPWINKSYDSFNADAYTNIKLSYEGQRQIYNGNTKAENYSHATDSLGKYDYLTAVATATTFNKCHFQFKRLSSVLRLVIKGLPTGVSYTTLTMYDASEDELRNMQRTTNITNSSSSDYFPYFNDVDITDSSIRYTLMLGPSDGSGLSTTSTATSLVLFLMIPPVDLTGRTIVFRLTPKENQEGDPKPYFCQYNGDSSFGSKFEANGAYSISMTAHECSNYNINVKVAKDWTKGNVVAQSRATGDPGVTDELKLPKYLYAFFVNDGNLVSRAYAENIDASFWSEANDIYSYSGSWMSTDGTNESSVTSLTLDASNSTNPRVYIIASQNQISSWKDASGNAVTFACGTQNATDESVIQGLSYNYADQDILNLYSTAYVDGSSFAGTLGDDVKDVRLYHVASKVDINWENNTSTALSGSVSLNNFPTTNLSFFKPTSTEYTTGLTGTASTAITTGTAYNGRAVFYVPQPSDAKYNVTIGSTTQDITFTPDATYTSWFRGNVTIK